MGESDPLFWFQGVTSTFLKREVVVPNPAANDNASRQDQSNESLVNAKTSKHDPDNLINDTGLLAHVKY